MRGSGRFSVIPLAIISASFACAIPTATFAGGTTNASSPTPNAAAAKPRPDTSTKVWTNDDLAALGPRYQEATPQVPDAATSNQVPLIRDAGLPAVQVAAANAPINPERDPRWYGDQITSLEGQLADIDAQTQRLREVRASNSGAPTGLVLNAPCDGITTDNLLQQLADRRQQVLERIDALGDTARANGMAPGILVEGRGLVQTEAQPTAEEQRAALIDGVRQRSDELAQTRAVLADMHAQVASQGISLLPPTPGAGGNMTTDLQQRLDDHANALQSQINGAESDARSAGIDPGELR